MAPKGPSALDKPSAEKFDDESDTAPKKKPSTPKQASAADVAEKKGKPNGKSPIVRLSTEKSDDEQDDDTVSEAGSDTESDSEFIVKPTVTESPKPNKPSAAKSAPKQASASASDVPEKKEKPPIVRLWTEESELAALRAMHEYKFNKGLDPYADTLAFFEFAKKFIPLEVTRNQVIDKLRRLKKRFENKAQKGGDPVFKKAHEQMAFEVSKKIWGSGAESGAKSPKRKSKRVEDSVEKESNKKAKKGAAVGEGFKVDDEVGFWDKYPWLKEAIEVENNGSFFKAMEFHLSKMGDANAKELDDNWKRYQVKEAKLKLLKSKLVTKLTKVVLGELMKL